MKIGEFTGVIPEVDSSENTHIEDVVGNKEDTVAGDSIVSLNKQILDEQQRQGTQIDTIEQEAFEIDNHLHNNERWFAAATVPISEIHVADAITDSQTAFVVDAGNNIWGSWIQIIGTDDTPIQSGMVKIDIHRMLVVGHERNSTTYFIQISFGETGDLGITAGNFTEIGIQTGGGISKVGPIQLIQKRHPVGAKFWARTWAVGQNTGTLDFYLGIHEYTK